MPIKILMTLIFVGMLSGCELSVKDKTQKLRAYEQKYAEYLYSANCSRYFFGAPDSILEREVLTSTSCFKKALNHADDSQFLLHGGGYIPDSFPNAEKISRLKLSEFYDVVKLNKVLGHFPNLKSLEMDARTESGHLLKSWPDNLFKLTQLTHLSIGGYHQMKRLPSSIGFLNKLEFLELKRVQVEVIPQELFLLKDLKELRLNETGIKVLPKEISALKQLEILDLWLNDISEVPKEIGELRKLYSLSLSMNHISTLPDEIGQLNKLVNLGLSHNEFDSIPRSIKSLKKLERLSIDKNQISILPLFLTEMRLLKGHEGVSLWGAYINLRENKISYLDPKFCEFKKLHLSGNPIKIEDLNKVCPGKNLSGFY